MTTVSSIASRPLSRPTSKRVAGAKQPIDSRLRASRVLNPHDSARVAVANVNHPGKARAVDATKYHAMRRAILQALPAQAPGLTLAELTEAVVPQLSQALFPCGLHAGWWLKTVQLDLEAKRVIVRDRGTPLRLWRV